jgi:Kef-type K+ transport system membrane component KefB
MGDAEFPSKWPRWVRWLAVLPAAILGAVLGWLFGALISQMGDDPSGLRALTWLAAFFMGVFFVALGTSVAPTHRLGKFATAVTLGLVALAGVAYFVMYVQHGLSRPVGLIITIGAASAVVYTAVQTRTKRTSV